ncbi:MAG: glycosyltransferase family 4 protein [Candidatus Pacebacteria bacterium]|jgi:glycosyltransferase involved in cell wall biosynthesis|nr:glycosyltransferase family 4 protein [Candidatus Paceibacterota bacterium]MBT3512198.1 glycosyltransferase family 4 protein [Candidatus Paceibacterota bacterium]MBT4004572.1 glycosyltransferase family 4 protein [Candidatus Paceibacterota bacterium]MBT4359180.1 glycosyltransferase family 4 protein [Candidatus Paceibacterota bacterium]MBT4681066.1 glycosyltransferase family 4 protein [Candidatus Paceibacterota bacterium]
MKICIYSPYIPKHTGGGEKYILDVATSLAKKHTVSIAIPQQYAGDASIVKKYERFLNRSLDNVFFVPSPLGSAASFIKKLFWTRQFDVVYYLTDGSLFLSLAKKNILHIQFPLKIDKSSTLEQFKLKKWQVKNTNSEFTKEIVESSWPVKVDLIHNPLVDVGELSKASHLIKKEKIILSVGRFFRQLHSKRQDVLIDVFRKLVTKYPTETKGWKLVFIGSVEDKEYLSAVKRKKRGLPVEFYHDLDRKELLDWYAKASIYWHAAGFNVDQEKHPEKVEHFGISTAEAMSAGCVPVVHGKGGQLEVLGEKLINLLWNDEDECLEKTKQVMSSEKLRSKYQGIARKQVKNFDLNVFEKKLFDMINS